MIIHLYTVCKNEEDFIPYFLKYYEQFVDKITVYDNMSTDNSRDLFEAHEKCKVIEFNTNGEARDDVLMWIKNSVWKDSIEVADWVIVADVDELLYHPKLLQFLSKCKKKGYTICETRGFNMISDDFPNKDSQITSSIKSGFYSKMFCKKIIFNPNKIENINYSPGAHSVSPEGEVKMKSYDGLKVLHYKYLGGITRIKKRWLAYGNSLSQINIDNNWAKDRKDENEVIRRYNELKANAKNVLWYSYYQKLKWFLGIY